MTPSKNSAISRRTFFGKSGGLGTALALSSAMSQTGSAQLAASGEKEIQTNSDVGSLYPLIEKVADRSGFPLSFLNSEFKSLRRWKPKARGKLLELLHYSPEKCDPEAEVVEKVDKGTFVREKIYFNTAPGIRVPAYLLIPKNHQKPMPALVALHDHGGFYLWGKEKLVETEDEAPILKNWRKTYYGDKAIAEVLANQGYVVLVIDMFYWGERRLLLDGDEEDWLTRPSSITQQRINAFNQRASQSEQLVGRTIFSAGFTWAGLMFWDDLRSVDYLVSRPEVDPKRIGCVGLSVGGLRSCHLAAMDDRIKAAVVVGWMTSFPAQLKRHVRNTIGHTKLVPGLYLYLDYPDVATLAIPAALLVINGKKDGLFEPGGVSSAFEKLAAVYKKAGIPEKVKTSMYDAPHEFNAEMQDEAWEWLRRWV